MPGVEPGAGSPIAPHRSTPQELKERIAAERAGAPHLIFRDADERQLIVVLPPTPAQVTVGRRVECDVSLPWDAEVSRLHAELELVGRDWTIVDDGLSSNGSYVNSVRLHGRHRLRDGDVVVVGQTAIVFRSPGATFGPTRPAAGGSAPVAVSDNDRRVLIALCRPLANPANALPASNQAIADELHLSLPGVKKRMSALFERFGLVDLPQTEKRARLASAALQHGIVTARDLT